MKDPWPRRRQREVELDAEIRSHLEMAIRERVERGESPEQARANTLREFGNVSLVKEVTREMWGWRWFEQLFQDLRFGWRMLRKNPGFTLIAALSLALGIGANTAIFSLLDALLLKTLPVKQPEQLVIVEGLRYSYPGPVYREMHEKNSAFAGMFTFHSLEMTMSDGSQAERVLGELVSGDFFTVLGVTPHLGRVFSDADDQTPGAHLVAVLSYDFWQRRFGADPNITGKKISINNHSFTIIGVSVQAFRSVEVGVAPDVRIPMMMKSQMLDRIDSTPVMARLKPGVSIQQAQIATDTLFQNIIQTSGANSPADRSSNQRRIQLRSASTGVSDLRGQFSQPLILLMCLVGVVLFIACLNVANLLLARAATRQKEIAVRLAVGAGRFRLVRQLLTEGFLLSALGGALGLAFARWGTDVLLEFLPQNATLEIKLDGRMLGFTLVVTMLAGLLFGLAPALQATRFELIPALKNDDVGLAGSKRRWELRRLLVVLQVALSLVLLVSGGLFARSLRNLKAVDHGYTTDQIVTMEIAPDRSGYKYDQQRNFYAQLSERVTALPGVKAVTDLGFLPFGGIKSEGEIVEVPGYQARTNEKPTSLFNGRQRLCVRATNNAAALVAAIRHEVRGLDPNMPVYNVKTFADQINESISRERLIALLASFFSLFALLLAALGLYGVMAYTVARRAREIGIRMALGARVGNVLWPILRETLLLALIGIAIGLPAALAATKLMKGLLFGLTANDSLTIAMATLMLIGIALPAGYLPARRAARVDPLIALRHE